MIYRMFRVNRLSFRLFANDGPTSMTLIVGWLLRQSKTLLTVVGIVVALLIGAADYLTGFELSFGVFYLIPVFLVSWTCGRSTAIAVSACSAILWFAADVGGGHVYSHPAYPYWNAAVRFGFFLAVAHLASRLKEEQDKEGVLARMDPLTSLPNRRAFLEVAERESSRTRRHKHSLTVAYIDLDNFKAVNDRHGHNEGDALLKLVAHTLRENIRETDCAARLGGDEFAILLPETDTEGAKTYLEKLRSRLLRAMRSHNWPVTFSIGSITFSRFVAVEEMLQRADALMYKVKQGSKDAIAYELTREDIFTQGTQTVE